MTQDEARLIAREEIASLCGLVLRRVHEAYETKDAMRVAEDDALKVVASIFAEALRDFGGTSYEPGEA